MVRDRRGHISLRKESHHALSEYAACHHRSIKDVAEEILSSITGWPFKPLPSEKVTSWKQMTLALLRDWATAGWLREHLPPVMSQFVPAILKALEDDGLVELHRGHFTFFRRHRRRS